MKYKNLFLIIFIVFFLFYGFKANSETKIIDKNSLINQDNNIKEIKGIGEAILGNGTTLEQIEEIALILAKRDALEKYGIYIESNTIVKNSKVETDEIKVISSGIIKLKSKKLVNKSENNIITVIVEAIFEIDSNDLTNKLVIYEKNKSKEIINLINKINEIENNLEEFSKKHNLTYEQVKQQLYEIKFNYENLGNLLKFDGKSILSTININRNIRLKNLKSFLEQIKPLVDPLRFFNPQILGKPKITDYGQGKIKIVLDIQFEINKKIVNDMQTIIKNYEKDIFSIDSNNNCTDLCLKPDDVTNSFLFPLETDNFPFSVAFLDSNKKVLAIYIQDHLHMKFNFHNDYFTDTQKYSNLFFKIVSINVAGESFNELFPYNQFKNNENTDYSYYSSLDPEQFEIILDDKIFEKTSEIILIISKHTLLDPSNYYSNDQYESLPLKKELGYNNIFDGIYINLTNPADINDIQLNKDFFDKIIDKRIKLIEEKLKSKN